MGKFEELYMKIINEANGNDTGLTELKSGKSYKVSDIIEFLEKCDICSNKKIDQHSDKLFMVFKDIVDDGKYKKGECLADTLLRVDTEKYQDKYKGLIKSEYDQVLKQLKSMDGDKKVKIYSSYDLTGNCWEVELSYDEKSNTLDFLCYDDDDLYDFEECDQYLTKFLGKKFLDSIGYKPCDY